MKKGLIKSISIIICVTLIAAAFAGCGTGSKEQAGTSTATTQAGTTSSPTTKPVKMDTIKVWCGGGSDADLWTKMVDEFNNSIGKEKGITIAYTPTGADYWKTLDVVLASGQEAEILQIAGLKQTYAKRGDILPIEDMPGGSDFLKNYSGMLASPTLSYEGKTYSVPAKVTNLKLIYNKELFKKVGIVDANGNAKPPVTWAEVREDAKKLTNPAEKVYGIALPLKWAGFFDWDFVLPFVSSTGHNVFDNKAGKYNLKDFKPALEWLMEIKADKSYFPGAEGLDNDPARSQFAEGRVGMIMGASWDVGVYNNQFVAKMDWGAADIPVFDTNNRYMEVAMIADLASISKVAKDTDMEKVMEVYKWINSDKVLATMYEECKSLPYKNDITKLATKQPSLKGWSDFARVDKAGSIPPGPSEGVKIEGDTYQQVFMKIWAGAVTIDQGIADLDKRYNDALDKGIKDGSVDIKSFANDKFDFSIK